MARIAVLDCTWRPPAPVPAHGQARRLRRSQSQCRGQVDHRHLRTEVERSGTGGRIWRCRRFRCRWSASQTAMRADGVVMPPPSFDQQMARLESCFPKSHGKPRVVDRRVLSGIVRVNRIGLRRRDALDTYGPQRRFIIAGSDGVKRAFPSDDVRSGSASVFRTQDSHDRRDLSKGPLYGIEPYGKLGARDA